MRAAGWWLIGGLVLGACSDGGSGDTGGGHSRLSLERNADVIVVSDGRSRFVVDGAGGLTRWEAMDGTLIVASAPAGAREPLFNLDYQQNDDRQDGIDQAYPGLPDISYRAYAFRTVAGWQAVEGFDNPRIEGDTLSLDARTSDASPARLRVRFAADGAVELQWSAGAEGVQASAMAWAAPAGQSYYGGGQRFSAFDLRGTSLPLWISHGPQSNRQTSTNEIAASFFWTPDGWGAWGAADTRGEINFGNPLERADAVNLMQETADLRVVLYRGTPAQILAAHTARAGRPQWTPPDWMFAPMVWQDSDTTTESVRALVDGMQSRDIPLGAVWLDNPWDAGKGSFDFDPARFADPDALIREVHDKDVRFMVWLSPYMTGDYETMARENGWLVTGTRPDGNDATYYPPRGYDPHLDFTHPAAREWWTAQLRGLIRRGIDGVKVDRGEEDLSDESVWFNGRHNRDNHNAYIGLYHEAIYDAFRAERGDDFTIFARGGWNGSARWAGHWAADNTSISGELGLTQAVRSLLSLSVSGFPFNGADIGGYAGTRQDAGESSFGNPLALPLEGTYQRWLQLGALSPIMQTCVPPWWVSNASIASYRRYATLHDRLVPYIAAAAKRSIEDGLPIVQPMAFAFPADKAAHGYWDQYLFGPDLLVAPIHDLTAELPLTTRVVYLPAGDWRDFWTGDRYSGPLPVIAIAPIDRIPLYVREGAQLPDGVAADQLP
ncbi:MAG TPA: glycoside hydrolase family 31 protein [Fontimonas sp.]